MALETKGFAETMRDLGKIQPAMKRQVIKDIRGIVKPVVDVINARIPSQAPLSGMNHNGRTGWSNVKKVAVKVDLRAPRSSLSAGTQGAQPMSLVRIITKAHQSPLWTWLAKVAVLSLAENPSIKDQTLRQRWIGLPARRALCGRTLNNPSG